MFRYEEGTLHEVTDQVAKEISFTLYGNGVPLTTFFCSPEEKEALVLGFCVTEGYLNTEDPLPEMTLKDSGDMELALKKRKRFVTPHLPAKETFQRPNGTPVSLEVEALLALIKQTEEPGVLFQKTGGTHRVCLATSEGILYQAEDIGRHNALDKVIGKALLAGDTLDDKILLSSGRVSHAMMSKVLYGGVLVFISKGAPTSEAIELARRYDRTLIGFARGRRFNVYAGEKRILDLGVCFKSPILL